MKLFVPALLTCVLLPACGKAKTENAPDVVTPVENIRAAVPEIGPDTATPTAADTAIAPDTAVAAADTAPAAMPDQTTHLVWTHGKDGSETVWLRADAEGRPVVVATRKQAAGIYDGTLWLFEEVHLPFRETPCEDYERDGDKATPTRLKYLPNLHARAVAGAQSGNTTTITEGDSDFFLVQTAQPPSNSMVGEHWGRTIELVGGSPDKVMVIDCEGGFGCGAHGSYNCAFKAVNLVRDTAVVDLPAAEKAIAADAKDTLENWKKDPDLSDMGTPALTAVELLGHGGEPQVSYLFVGDVAYALTRGDWGSYSASQTFIGKIVPELGLGDVPALVKAYLAQKPKDVRFGWSTLAADAPTGLIEDLRKAFDDTSTLPSPAPAEEALGSPKSTDVDKLVNDGRTLTREKKYAEAIGAFDSAIAAAENTARAWSGRGYAKMLAGQLGEAQKDLEKALDLDKTPKFQSAVYYNLGEIAERLKDDLRALEQYEKALALNPSDAAKKRVARLKGE